MLSFPLQVATLELCDIHHPLKAHHCYWEDFLELPGLMYRASKGSIRSRASSRELIGLGRGRVRRFRDPRTSSLAFLPS